jgi:hypothetical protein
MLTAPSKAVTAGECLGCPKIVFERTKPPRIKYHSVCPSISCGAPEHFGYYPTCWTAWPFPPDYSHCPCPPAAATPSAPQGAAAPKAQLPQPRTLPEPTEPKTTEPKTTEPGLP